jgi:hypothetical protein
LVGIAGAELDPAEFVLDPELAPAEFMLDPELDPAAPTLDFNRLDIFASSRISSTSFTVPLGLTYKTVGTPFTSFCFANSV